MSGHLTNIACKQATYNPNGKGNKRSDGAGLILHIKEKNKYWHFNYRFLGKQKTISFGTLDNISLAEAREKRRLAKKQLEAGEDPAQAKKLKKMQLMISHENNFEAITRKWHEQNKYSWNPKHAEMILRRFETKIFPSIGKRPINEIQPLELIVAVEKVQDNGNHDLAHRMLQMCRKIAKYAVVRGICEKDFTISITTKEALRRTKSKVRAYISEKDLPEFLEKLDNYELKYGGKRLTKLAFQLLILTFVRSGEIRGARWSEIDFNKAEWRIPALRMKMKTEHVVPLSDQSIRILKQIKEITGNNDFDLVFPSMKEPNKIMSENTFLRVIEVLGYKGKATAHGFRSTASTILNERGQYYPDVIEHQLAHTERNQVRAAYNHAQYLSQRKEMMRWWGNYIENKGDI